VHSSDCGQTHFRVALSFSGPIQLDSGPIPIEEESIMQIIAKIFSIMLLGAGFFWGGIPLGLAFDFSLLAAGAITIAGAELAVLLILLFGIPLQAWMMRRFPLWMEKTRSGRAGKIWQSYGMAGLGLISPVVPGAPQSVLIALALGAKPIRIFLWVSAGIWLWGGLVMGGLALGVNAVHWLVP
jgi:hypothetical protein